MTMSASTICMACGRRLPARSMPHVCPGPAGETTYLAPERSTDGRPVRTYAAPYLTHEQASRELGLSMTRYVP